VRSGAAHTGCFAAEAACIPFWLIVGDERKLGRENPPLTGKGQVTACHIDQGDVLPVANLGCVLGKTIT